MQVKKILITGGAVFTGSTFAIYLKTKFPDYSVVSMNNNEQLLKPILLK